jgi:hypothetical protein
VISAGAGQGLLTRTDTLWGLGILSGTLGHLAYYFPRVVDDLFISLRYAENLAHGQGAVYNLGERVEGFSSPLWLLLQSLGIALGVEGVTWTKLLGVGSLLVLEYALFRLSRERFGVQGWLAWLPSLACAANSYLVNWSVLGLETPLHLALLALLPVAIPRLPLEAASLEAASPRAVPPGAVPPGAVPPGAVPPSGLSIGARICANAACVGFGLSRPESGLYLLLTLAAPLPFVRSRAALLALARQSCALFWPSGVLLGGLLLLRFGYYGHWVPNTAFVKASGLSFDVSHLAPLVTQGAGVLEACVYVAGSLLLGIQGWRARELRPALYVAGCLCFTALVRLDWMPSLRHLLPVTVFAPLGISTFLAMAARAPRLGAVVKWGGTGILVASLSSLLPIDNRNSPEENRGRGWIRPKTLEKWHDTWLSYRRIEPPHVRRMHDYEMGQITQAWHVLEASAEPVEQSWYVGRDIGAVGYYTGVRVFDTAGLFTPAVSQSVDWVSRRRVTDALIEEAMSLRPLAGEIYEGWDRALGRHAELLRGYRIRSGTPRAPVAFLATDRPPPAPDLVTERYRQLVDKFPKLFHLHTLYGEAVGAAVEKRWRIVQQKSAGAPPDP